MAQPILLTLPPRDPERDLKLRLEAAPAQHAEAIMSGLEVLQLMHDNGVLELMRGMLGGGDKIIAQAVVVAGDPSAVRAMRNALLLVKAFGQLEPELLSDLTSSIAPALSQANRDESRPPGLVKLLRTFWNKDFRRGLAAFNDLLEAFGRNLRTRGEKV